MIAPRISLRSVPFDLPIRLAEIPLDERFVHSQVQQVQKNKQIIRITPGAFYILSNIAGRRVVDPIRWVLLDSLRDILTNGLPTVFPERQDLLASTFGEMLGAIVLALKLGGNVEIVRLLESSEGTTPDFLVLETTNIGQVAHLLECKGFVEDVVNVNERGNIDICGHSRRLRNDGKKQLNDIIWDKLKTGPKVVTKPSHFAISNSVSSKYVSVVCVPDKRLPSMTNRSRVKMSPRPYCNKPNPDCLDCVAYNPSSSNAIAVLYQDKISLGTELDDRLKEFVANYRNVQRAQWSKNDQVFQREFNHLLESLASPEWHDDQTSVAILAMGLIQAANQSEITLTQIRIDQLSDMLPFERREGVERLLSAVSSAQQTLREIRTVALGEESFESAMRENQWQQDISKFLVNNVSSNQQSIYGSVERDEASNTTVTRLSVERLSDTTFDSLRLYVEELIKSARMGMGFSWQNEYVESGKRIELGVSWDEYPYPNPSEDLPLPGVTAWVSRDGMAEIIVRRRRIRPGKSTNTSA